MKQSHKDRLATLLMDELLERLSERESIRNILGEMTSLPIDEVIEHVLAEFERAVDEYHQKHKPSERRPNQVADPTASDVVHHELAAFSTPAARGSEIVQTVGTEPVLPVSEVTDDAEKSPSSSSSAIIAEVPAVTTPEEPEVQERLQLENSAPPVDSQARKPKEPETTVQLDPIRLEFPKIVLKVDLPQNLPTGRTSEVRPQEKEIPRWQSKKETQPKQDKANQEQELRRLEEIAQKIEIEYASRRNGDLLENPESLEQGAMESPKSTEVPESIDLDGGETAIVNDEEEESINIEPVGSGRHMAHARYTFADDDFVYVHAVSKIPDNEEPSPDPFMLEEKGIDGRGFAFALDYEGMRFYLSRINPNEMSISKSMVLLLNKQESLQLQGVHESTLNDLRGHGILLPFEFGTVARGRDQFFSIIDKNKEDVEEALEEIQKTTWWTVTASVLDGTIAGIVGTDVQTVGRDRSRDRASYTSAPQLKKFDIKVLERILQREKKIAEAVHTELSAVAERSEVETIVGLGSGSSEDWKVILKGSYEVPTRDAAKFSRAVTDLQYHHLRYDLMLSLTADRDFLTLRRK